MNRKPRGFTLIELMITIAVLAILVAVGMPQLDRAKDKRALRGVARQMDQDFRVARSEAIKQNTAFRVTFTGSGATWCYGVAPASEDCDCTQSDECITTVNIGGTDQDVRVVRSSGEFEGVELNSASFSGGVAYSTFNPTFGTATNGTVEFESAKGVDAQVVVSTLGRIRVCSDSSDKYGFEACP